MTTSAHNPWSDPAASIERLRQSSDVPREVELPGLAWEAISGSEVLGGGGPWRANDAELQRRVDRSGYCMSLVWALATARVVRRGRSRSYRVYLDREARNDLGELLDALSYGARDDGTSSERRAISTALARLRA